MKFKIEYHFERNLNDHFELSRKQSALADGLDFQSLVQPTVFRLW